MSKKLINWEKKYSIGFEEIDNQHKKLVEMINELHKSFTHGGSIKTADKIIGDMIEYTDYHFKIEEKYFEKYNYSEKQEHIIQHKSFVKQVTEFYNDFQDGSVTIGFEIMNFLRKWLLEHIEGSDNKYAKEFKNKNITEL